MGYEMATIQAAHRVGYQIDATTTRLDLKLSVQSFRSGGNRTGPV